MNSLNIENKKTENSENVKISKHLTPCIEERNDDELAELWLDVSSKVIVCVDIENEIFYKFNEDLCLYEMIEYNEFENIVKKT